MKKKSLSFLKKRKNEIDKYNLKLISDQKKIYHVHSGSKPTFDYLEKFLNAGKTVRGSMFLEFAQKLKKLNSNDLKKLTPIASAIEIIHSSLLIQDDYMDQDTKRRGMESFFSQRMTLADKEKIQEPYHYAVSSLMCATDVCFFIAFAEIAKVDGAFQAKIFDFISREYSHLGFAQWKEVLLGKRNGEISFEEIETIYRYKTARYTFTIPVILASIISGIDDKNIKLLDKASESIGMVFQIRDDHLSLFGNPKITGKNLGNDIIENKKTFYLYFLTKELEKNNNKNYKHILDYFGKKNLSKKEIIETQLALNELKVTQRIEKLINEYEKAFLKILEKININTEAKELLINIFEYIKDREK